jgi:hypothetical protein
MRRLDPRVIDDMLALAARGGLGEATAYVQLLRVLRAPLTPASPTASPKDLTSSCTSKATR